jgi:hypothetical protein
MTLIITNDSGLVKSLRLRGQTVKEHTAQPDPIPLLVKIRQPIELPRNDAAPRAFSSGLADPPEKRLGLGLGGIALCSQPNHVGLARLNFRPPDLLRRPILPADRISPVNSMT